MAKIRPRCKMYHWECMKCGKTMVTAAERQPAPNGCRAGGYHMWRCAG